MSTKKTLRRDNDEMIGENLALSSSDIALGHNIETSTTTT